MSSWFGLTEPYGSGQGFQTAVRGDNPAAGASYLLKLDPRWIWRLVSAVFTLTTSVSAANRYVTVEYQDGDGNTLAVNGAAVILTASSTQRWAGSLIRGHSEWAANTDVLFPILPVFMQGGNVLTITVANVQAADQLSKIVWIFDRFPTNPENYPGDES